MTSKHWICIIVALLIGYLIGVKWPSYGESALSTVGLG